MNGPTDRLSRVLALGTGVALFAWFVFVIRGGLASWFDADDLMNLHHYWSRPWPALIKANVFFWSSYYRPGGGLFYRSIYALWGFHPLPFRIAAHVFLCANFGLLALVVWQLTRSRWGTLAALLVVGIHPAFSSAYFDTGAIYDVLAYTFFWGAFVLYVHARQAGRLPGWRGLVLLLCLFVAALDCKEISVVLPVAVALYELVWHPPAGWKPAALWRWIRQEGRFAAIGAVFNVAYIAGKRYGPESLWTMEAYRPRYSAAAYLQSLSHYLHELVYEPAVTTSLTAALLAAMVALAAISRRRSLMWGAGFVLISVLPLAFIPGRGGFAYLVPAVGWAVYAGGLLDWLVQLTCRRAWLRGTAQVLLFALLFTMLAPWQRKWIEMHSNAAHDMQGRFRRYQDQIRALIPAPRKGARILLLTDAGGYDDYDVVFLIRLYYGDPELQAERMTVWKQHNVQINPAGYDYVLDWINGQFVLVGRK